MARYANELQAASPKPAPRETNFSELREENRQLRELVVRLSEIVFRRALDGERIG